MNDCTYPKGNSYPSGTYLCPSEYENRLLL
jgi:hypothetical protein